jgi:LmbE family N-acetylglucosaminyl deacetylase
MGLDEIFAGGRVLVVAAHPDDETVGLGVQLSALGTRATILHITDGSPRNLADARKAGFSSQRQYAMARRQEFFAAMALAGVAAGQCQEMGLVDQESALELERIARTVRSLIANIKPDAVFTHPYEGGHPDHDSTAFGVHGGMSLLRAEGHAAPPLYEFTSYYGGRAGIVTGKFLPREGLDVTTRQLTFRQQALKRKMFDCFGSQQTTLAPFRLDAERFRLAPEYDFLQPPHGGRLYYENFDWGMTAPRWRQLASDALSALRASKNHAAPNP